MRFCDEKPVVYRIRSKMPHRVPSYRLHKASGQAVVTLCEKDHYLGQHGTPDSRAEYDRLIARWLIRGHREPPRSKFLDLTINELLVRYLNHCEVYYRRPDGTPTTEADCIRISLRPLKHLNGHTIAEEFGPTCLKAVRQKMLDDDLCRNEINKRLGRIKRFFKWAVAEELIPSSVFEAVRTVEGLKRGRSKARETKKVCPVPDDHVEAVLPHVNPAVAAMIQIQRRTGMRPGEVCQMRTCDIDRSASVWSYRPRTHKTAVHGHERIVQIGPQAQKHLLPWLRPDTPEDSIFSPKQAVEALNLKRSQNRATPMTPSQRSRKRKSKPKRAPRSEYTEHAYYYAIRRGCEKAEIPPWHPHQLRHSFATEVRRQHGLDVVRCLLGQKSLAIAEHYAEQDVAAAMRVAVQVG